MKKAEVKIGGKYYANVSGNRCEIRIDAEKPRGGWDATNLGTGKKILIKSAQRLQGEVGMPLGRTKVATEGEETAVPDEAAAVETIDGETLTAVLKKPHKVKTADAGPKALSCIAAALKVLSESDTPLNTKQMIETMEAKGYWASPGGRTPHATLYSAILRDLAKGDESRFVKTVRGQFSAR